MKHGIPRHLVRVIPGVVQTCNFSPCCAFKVCAFEVEQHEELTKLKFFERNSSVAAFNRNVASSIWTNPKVTPESSQGNLH